MAKHFSFDHENGFQVWRTQDEAREAAQEAINDYREAIEDDDNWLDDVEAVCWGEIGGQAKAVFGGDFGQLDYELQEVG